MVLDAYYKTPIAWTGRSDLPDNSCYFQIVKYLNLNEAIEKANGFALLGFCSDEGITRNLGRKGAKEGPSAIKKTLAKLAISPPPPLLFDAGDILNPAEGELEKAQLILGESISNLHQNGLTPIVLGGGHELSYGHFLGLKSFANKKLAIVNFDAHFDMRPLRNKLGTSGTPFLQIAQTQAKTKQAFHYFCLGIQPANNIPLLFETASSYHVDYVLAEDFHLGNTKAQNLVENVINNFDYIYVSLCLDVFAAPYAPGVSAPQPLGLTPWQVIPLLRQLVASKKVISYDIAELSPQYDIDERTAKLAANLLVEIISPKENDEYK